METIEKPFLPEFMLDKVYKESGLQGVIDFGRENKMPFSYCNDCEVETPTLICHAEHDICGACGSYVNQY